jgi:hypothetical protein
VQALHAAYQLAAYYAPGHGIPNIILIGLPDADALRRAWDKLKKAQIVHYAWHEPDNDFGLTSIATIPIDGEQKEVLKNYRLWRNKEEFNAEAVTPQGVGSELQC